MVQSVEEFTQELVAECRAIINRRTLHEKMSELAGCCIGYDVANQLVEEYGMRKAELEEEEGLADL